MWEEMDVADWIERRGFGSVDSLVCEALILYEGWEMDNHGWVVKMKDGSIKTFTTDHGGLRVWHHHEAVKELAKIEESAASMREALKYFKA